MVHTAKLSIIYSASLKHGMVPSDWKTAHVIPLYKGEGDTSSVNSYRPISLTSHASKTMERIIKKFVFEYMDRYNLISKCQHGFLSGRSTGTNLIECIDVWTKLLDKGKFVDHIP